MYVDKGDSVMTKPEVTVLRVLSLAEAVKYIIAKYDDVDYGSLLEMRDYLDNFTDMSVPYTEIDFVTHFRDAHRNRVLKLAGESNDDLDDVYHCEDDGYRLMFLLLKEFDLDQNAGIIWKLCWSN